MRNWHGSRCLLSPARSMSHRIRSEYAVVRELAEEKAMPFFEISAVTGQGIDALRRAMAGAVLPSEVADTKEA